MASEQRGGDRKAVGLLVKLKHPNIGSFVEEFATNLSPGGMFIRSRSPQPAGTDVRFEIQIADGLRVMRGTAVVKWIRPPGDPRAPAGMGLQFKSLDGPSRALIDQMLQLRRERAPAAADLGAPPPSLAPMAEPGPPGSLNLADPALPPTPLAAPAMAPVDLPPGDKPDLALDALVAAELEDSLAPPPPAEDDIDISLDELVAATPPPEPEIPIELATEEEPEGLELSLDLADLEEPPPSLPQFAHPPVPDLPAAQPPPEPAGADGEEVELDIEEAAEAPPGPATPPVAAPAASIEPLPQLPTIRREAPRAAAPAVSPTLAQAPALSAAPAPAPVDAGPAFLRPPASLPTEGPVIGIDLGTTNSCVALVSNGRPLILRSKEGYNTIPSVVSLNAVGKLLVGRRAQQQLVLNPAGTIYGAKRLMGLPFESPTVRQVRERFHYEIVPDPRGKAAVRLGGKLLSLEEVQGIVLRECKEMAETELGQSVGRAVVTVPAYYSEPQREAVRSAGAMAGLRIERILNEPTAAALAFGLNRELSKNILVYDLGGGTFDATVLRIDKNVFEVLATGGDTFLGGVDFDNVVVDHLLAEFQRHEKVAFSGDDVALSRVSDAAERTKVALSERQSHEVHIPMLMMDADGRPRDLRSTVTREQLDGLADGLVARTLEVVRDVLLDAKLKAAEVDEIILVGGQSRMPLVRERLKKLFGKSPHASVNADEAVALGAALFSGSVDKVSSVVLIDVLPMTIGVGLPGGGFKRIVERNTPLPAQRSFAISTSRDNEQTLEFSVFQGEDLHISANEYLGTVRMEGLPKGPKGSVKLAVTLKLDPECVLHVEARELTSRKQLKATLATLYTPEELQKRLNISADSARQASEKRGQELQERGGGFWSFLKRAVGRGQRT